MAKIINKENEKIFESVKNIPIISEKQGWVFTLDREEGSLFYSPEILPDNVSLRQITDEYAVYFDKDLKPHGVMVEYFNQNFMQHHKSFKKLISEIFTGNKKIQIIDPVSKKNKEEKTLLKALFENTLIKEAGIKFV